MRLLVTLLFGVFLTMCGQPEPPARQQPSANEPVFREDGRLQFLTAENSIISEVSIEIAETVQSREQGMMYRTSMEPDHAMLFIFDRSEPRRFWMANTYISLDLLFVNEALEIVRVARYAQPQSQEGIDCPELARYVVEVIGGYADTHGLIEGQKIAFSRNQDLDTPQTAEPTEP